MNLALWITAIATVIIAYFAYSNFRLAKEIKETREKHDEETKDLYQAIVIASLINSKYQITWAITKFANLYKGTTEIFGKDTLKEISKTQSRRSRG